MADAWCAAFVWPKQPGELADVAPTNDLWRQLRDSQGDAPKLTTKTVEELAGQYRFFHWHLQFPQVFAKGGFNVVLGNPPWVRQELLKFEKRLLTQFASFASTADSSVYFIERGIQVGSASGFVAMLTPNKWFRAAYAEDLRTFVRQKCRVTFIVDFGHSRTLFPDADTFPALVAFRPVLSPVADTENATFVRAHDADLAKQSLQERIATARVSVAHASLKAEHWHLEGTAVTSLLDRLLKTGKPLEASSPRGLLSGLKTGFNDAFYVDSATKKALVALDPSSAPLFKKMLRGRDIKRWTAEWAELWHIVIASSQNHTWPWSSCTTETKAESVFAKTHPSVHQHLKKFESALRTRQDRGAFWWELRSCDYYDVLDDPKILVQCIAYYSQFALDQGGHVVNNKVLIIPSDDPFLVGVLNSRLVWWIVNRTFQHMKDEGLSVDVQYLKKLPIPVVPQDLHATIANLSVQIAGEANTAARARMELALDQAVMRAFEMTPTEEKTLVESLPPRDPIERAKDDLVVDVGSTSAVVQHLVAVTGGAKVMPLPVKHAERPQSAVALATAVVPEVSAVAAESWARPHTMERGEIQAAIIAVLKANNAPMDRHQARLASLLCLEPHLLPPMLDPTETTHWMQLVGSDAKKTVDAHIDATAQEWGPAIASLRARNRVIEDLQQNTWALSDDTDAIDTSGWPDGRAGFVVNVLVRLQQSTHTDAIILKLPTIAQEWLANAAA